MQIDYQCLLHQDRVWQDVAAAMKTRGVQGGVYRVHALDARAADGWTENDAVPISRAVGRDPWGILYIGMAGTFTNRFIDLMKTLHPKYRTDIHTSAKIYSESNVLKAAFPVVGFTLRFAPNPRDAEREELTTYRETYGEFPPLNAQS